MPTVATTSQVKAGTDSEHFLAPSVQDNAVFYALAKVAGADMKNLSGETVGVYPEAQKVAIQKMLGIYEAPWELLNDITLTEESTINLSADGNGTPYNLRSVYVRVYYTANLITASAGYGRYRFIDENGVYMYTETGKYSTNGNSAFKTVLVEHHGNLAIASFTRQTVTNNYGASWICHQSGISFEFGNIVQIMLYNNDPEPAGTRIQIYGQRAY